MIERIVSGGQTGVDRAALDAALAADFPCGGWCPQGRWAEDGVIPMRYPLAETPLGDPSERTRRNVEQADGTLILAPGGRTDGLVDGTVLAADHARDIGKPLLVLAPVRAAPQVILRWVDENDICILNVAGPRASTAPEVYTPACQLMAAVVRALQAGPVRSAPGG